MSKTSNFNPIKKLKNISFLGCLLLFVTFSCVSTANAYQLSGVKWPRPATTFYVNIPGEDGLWDDAFEGAMYEWGAATAFKFYIVRETYSDPCDSSDNKNGVKFSSTDCGDAWGSTTLAICHWWYTISTSTITQADIVFNSNKSWNVYSTSWSSWPWNGVNDFRRVAVHELGHALGLGHEDSGVSTIMRTYAGNITTPQQDDIDGVAALYGSACTYSISPTSGSFTSSGGTGSVSVTASSSTCVWTTSESLSWVSLSPTSGTGGQAITVTVAANTGAARSGSVTIAGKTYTIFQGTIAFADSIKSVDYFPIESGMAWTYIEDGINSVTISILEGTTSINGNLTKTALRTGGEFSGTIINLTNNANGINRYREFSPNVFIEDVGFQDITVTYSPPLKFAKATSTVGEIFNSTGILDYTFSSLGTYPLNYDSTTKLVKFENITVPAGSFATVKIQNSITIYGYINGQYLSIPITGVSWYAKYIGSVKSIQTSNGVQTTQELTSINFQPFLKSDFSVNQVNGIAPLSLIFTDQSDGNISSWLWSFGDGGTSTLQNPSHTYNTPGIYTVSLSVSGMGDSDVETKSNYINIKYPPPLADFSVNQVNGIAPLSLTFTDQSDGNISSWSWFFGDGGTSTLQNPSHTYNIPGTYTVSLSVEGLGGADLETKTKYIKVALAASDIDNSQKVDLNDLYLVLKILTINHEQPLPLKIFDIDGDNKTGIEEASYILYFMAE